MCYECCVCKSSRQDAILHRLPCSEKRLNKWLKCIKREDLKKMSPVKLSKVFVCHKHFEKRFITPKSRLIANAYPSLITDDEISTGIPTRENVENWDPQLEHNYTQRSHFDHTYCKLEPLKEHTTSDCSDFQNLRGTSQNPSTMPIAGLDKEKKKVHKRRLVANVAKLTPECKTIYKEYKKSLQQTNFYRRANRALRFHKDKCLEKLMENLNPYGKMLLKMQINLSMKKKKGRRFSIEEKLIALSILKQSPKCYRFLQKIFILPSRTTLNIMVSKLNIHSGICSQVFELMKKEVAVWNEKKKMCSVIFDEMSLETALTYDKSKDSINGLVELIEKKNEFADHVLVFLLRGAIYKWQQPIAYYFCRGATSAVELQLILKKVISAVVGCGLKPIAIISDQGTAFQSALKRRIS